MMALGYSIMKDVISDLEHIIGRNCYNDKFIDNSTGKPGNIFRYPVKYIKDRQEQECRGKASFNDITAEEEIRTMRYDFGSNHVIVGKAIAEILDYLEERYELDFARLESDGEWLD